MDSAIAVLSAEGFEVIAPPLDCGVAPQLRWIPIDALHVDFSYQREISGHSRRNVERIAAAFSWEYFAPVVVAPLEGGDFYVIIDGQHRTTAAKLIGKTTVPCSIVTAPRAAQARAFAAINGAVTRIHPLQIHKANVAAREPRALEIEAIAREGGATILGAPRAAQRILPGQTLAAQSIGQLAERHSRESIVRALLAVTAAKRPYRGLLNRDMLGALSARVDLSRGRAADLARFHAINLAVVEQEAFKIKSRIGGRLGTHIESELVKRLHEEAA